MRDRKILYFILFLIIVGIVTLVYLISEKELVEEEDNSSSPETNQTASSSGAIQIAPGVFAEVLSTDNSTSTISKLDLETLKKPIVFKDNNYPEINKTYSENIKSAISILEKDPANFDRWNDLGLYRKNIQDYEGAIVAWKNAVILRPESGLPLSNLGNLYGYYLKDPVTAEDYYLKSIKAEPNLGFWYYQTFTFYREVLNNDAKAKAIIEAGVKENPGDAELKNVLDALK